MEVINPDWYVCLERNSRYFKNCCGAEDYERELSEFAAYYKEKEYEYEQLMMYYVYRYFLNAVNDSEILLKAKIGVIGYLDVVLAYNSTYLPECSRAFIEYLDTLYPNIP